MGQRQPRGRTGGRGILAPLLAAALACSASAVLAGCAVTVAPPSSTGGRSAQVTVAEVARAASAEEHTDIYGFARAAVRTEPVKQGRVLLIGFTNRRADRLEDVLGQLRFLVPPRSAPRCFSVDFTRFGYVGLHRGGGVVQVDCPADPTPVTPPG